MGTPDREQDEVRAELTMWAHHATYGTPHPGQPGHAGLAIAERNWRGLVQHFGSQRREEQEHASKGQFDLRETIWAFVRCVHQIVVDDQENDRLSARELERIRVAVRSDSTETIKREVSAAMESMRMLADKRRERQRSQIATLGHRLRTLSTQLEEARRESVLDPLTQLANRKGFDDFVARSLELHVLSTQPATLLMIDLDRLKQLNDTFGHAAGDAALRVMSSTLARVFMRRCDFVCRYGGDEFAVVLHETDAPQSRGLAQRLLDAVAQIRLPELNDDVRVSASVGVAALRPDDDVASWVRRADQALYLAKKSGRGCVIEG
jgi:diguanylate cyclase (GGDEF)-like protein